MSNTTLQTKDKRENVAPKKKEWHTPRLIEVFYPREIKSIKDLHNWMNAVDLDNRLNDRDKRILNRLARHLHLKTGRLDPYLDVLALELSIESPTGDVESTRRMIRRSLELAEKLGWIERTQRSAGYRRNRSNAFRLTIPQNLYPDSTVRVGTEFHTRTPQSVQGGLYSPVDVAHTRTPESGINTEREQEIKNSVKSLAPSGARESGPQADSGAEGIAGETRQQGIESNAPESKSGAIPFAPRAAPTPAVDGFAEFYAQFPKKVERRAAQVAYAKAIKRGVDPAIILRGAMRYAAERAGQDPKYTKHPATWLNKGCWDDEPSPRSGQPQNRNAGVARLLQIAGGSDE